MDTFHCSRFAGRFFLKTGLLSFFFVPIVGISLCGDLHAKPRASVKQVSIRAENTRVNGEEMLILPYGFASESMGTVLGVGGGVKGFFQEQLLIAGTVYAGVDDDTYGAVLGAWDLRPTRSDRLYFSAVGAYGHYPRQRAYADFVNYVGQTRPGSNGSEADDYRETGGENNWSDFRFEYVLPIGAMKSSGVAAYHLRGGMVEKGATGGELWNPLEGGVTTLMIRQYNQFESFNTEYGDFERPIHPIEIGIGYNNTDYPLNPSTGSNQYLGVKHDFGWGEALTEWTFLELEASKYFSLGESKLAKQRVIATNFWTGDALSWDEKVNEDGTVTIEGNPPQYDGANLGGFYRMRAYPSRRFHDRSVIYATAEYRYTPFWNPIGEWSLLRWLNMDWWQLVGFVEGGRVANEYDELFGDWKVDAGVSVRSMMAGGVVRVGWAVSNEESTMTVMFNHPF